MSKDLSLHVTYGSSTFILNTLRENFLPNVAKRLSIKPEEVEIYDASNQKIEVKNLTSVMKVRIKRKSAVANGENGKRGYSSIETPSTSSLNSDEVNELLLKIVKFQGLSMRERKYVVEAVKNMVNPSKRNAAGERPTKNRKIQVDTEALSSLKSTYTQTDELIEYQSHLNKSAANESLLIQSKKLASEEKLDPKKASELMSKSFDKRRNFIIMERPFVSFVKEKYPLLFNRTEILNELDRITFTGKGKDFIANIEKCSKPILSLVREDDPLLELTLKKMERYPTLKQKLYAQQVGALLMVPALLHEECTFLCLKDTNALNNQDFPHIKCDAKRDALFFDDIAFKIYAEHLLICEANDFKEAILCLIATYFVFNIQYPESSFNTFVFYEKMFLEAIDTDENTIDEFVQQMIRTVKLKSQNRK